MQRQDVNPWEWSKAFGFSQAVDLSGAERVVICSGQTGIGDDGAPPTTTDMAEQVRIAMENLGTVLRAANMDYTNIVKLTIFTTDVDEYLGASGAMPDVMASNLPAMTLIGVTRLAYPELKVEIEAIAAK
jgi:enamine deaminase RidA (YjgF/YER057c/UK114 family)